MKTFSFRKEERLTRRKQIAELFSEGKTLHEGSFLVFWKTETRDFHPFPAKAAISVPKKKIRKAVYRNLLKRRIREAYRTNKHTLYDYMIKHNLFMSLFILYQDNKILPYHDIERQVIVLLQKIIQENEKNTD